MPCGQVSILSRIKNPSGASISQASGASQVMRLSKPEDNATFMGPLRLNLSYVRSASMKSMKTASQTKSVDVENWRREIVIPAQHEFTINYKDYVEAASGGHILITASDDDTTTQTQTGQDLPCDFASTSLKPNQYIFPPSCEPCESSVVNSPPTCATPIPIPTAAGGCIRPRFFNGMFITREDMETQLRYIRVKQRLQNRAMGQGVVWGFPLFLEGTKLRVGAGYGVDCCGNDLTVTCDYSVSMESLLSDPALCGTLDDCASLVLEYVECLENPRPVHGESCGQAKPACEMSRVRETVRLRLKPKCDKSDHKDPLAEAFEGFLKILRDTTPTQPQPATPAEEWRRPPSAQIPWKIRVDGPHVITDRVLQPDLVEAQSAWVALSKVADTIDLHFLAETAFQRIEIGDGTPAPIATGSNAQEVKFFNPMPGGPQDPVNTPHSYRVIWSIADPAMRSPRPPDDPAILTITRRKEKDYDNLPTQLLDSSTAKISFRPGTTELPEPGQFIRLQGGQPDVNLIGGVLKVEPDTDPTRTAVVVHLMVPADVNLPHDINPVIIIPPHVHVELAPVPVEVPAPPPPPPPTCCADPCCGDLASMSSEDRLLMLVMALYYGRILQEIAELKARGNENQAGTALLELILIAGTLLRTLSRSRPAGGSLSDIDEAARELYRLWCCRAIYGGPHCGCDCGCSGENGGIVIGCAYFTAGQICRISPFDGRRWVLHPPLLQHWASAFGYPALDEAVMRLFSRLCCIGALPALPDKLVTAADALNSKLKSTAAYSNATYSASSFTSNTPMGAVAAVPDISTVSSDPECSRSLMTSLMRMLLSIETVSAAALVDNVNRFLCHPQCGLRKSDPENHFRREVMVRAMAASTSQPAADVHAVMRSSSKDLAASIAARAPLTAVPAAARILKPLQKGGVITLADLLAIPPEEAIRLVGSDHAAELNKTYPQAEALPNVVASAVSKAISEIDKSGSTAPSDWTKKDMRSDLEENLRHALKAGEKTGIVDKKSLADALDEWTSNIKARAKA